MDSLFFPGNSKALFSQRLNDVHVVALGEAVKRTEGLALGSIDLSYNQLGDDAALVVAEIISLMPSLHTIVLRGNDIGPEGCARLAEALAAESAVQRLDLRGNPVATDGGVALARMIKVRWRSGTVSRVTLSPPPRPQRNQRLLSLDLSDASLGTDAMVALTTALVVNHTLQELSVESAMLFSKEVHLALPRCPACPLHSPAPCSRPGGRGLPVR